MSLDGTPISLGTVQFDLDEDGVADGSFQATHAGTFLFDPRTVSISAEQQTLRFSGVWNSETRQLDYGDWSEINFTSVVNTPTEIPPAVSSVWLVSDPDHDGTTDNPLISGIVSDDGNKLGLPIQFGITEDDVAEGTTNTSYGGTGTLIVNLLPFRLELIQ